LTNRIAAILKMEVASGDFVSESSHNVVVSSTGKTRLPGFLTGLFRFFEG
jgi:hypothetical protein